jgi:hypothetical protein
MLIPAKAGCHGIERLLDVMGDLGGIGVGEAFYDKHQGRCAVQTGIADEWLVILGHIRHIADSQRSLGAFYRDVGELVRRSDGLDVLHAEPLVGSLDEPACPRCGRLDKAQGGHPERVTGRLDELGQCDLPGLQALRIHLDLQLSITHAPHRDVGRRQECSSAEA